MKESLLSNQMIFQSSLQVFDTDLINYIDDSVNNKLLDLENQYCNGLEALKNGNIEIDGEDYNWNKLLLMIAYEDNIIALLETKIIYLWKIFEVKLKELIRIAYNVDTKDFYKFESLISFLKEQGINLTAIKDYNTISDLLKVNNQCKHEGLLYSDKIKHIKEFSMFENSNHNRPFIQAHQFYNRIKDIPSLFLSNIKEEILKERLSFDESKYLEIAKPLVERMNEDKAIEFVQVFLKIYNLKPEQLNSNPDNNISL